MTTSLALLVGLHGRGEGDVDGTPVDEMVLAEFDEVGGALRVDEGDESEHAEGIRHEDVGDGAVFAEVRLQILFGDVLGDSADEDASR